MPKHGKRYRALLEKVDPGKVYTIDEAARLVKELATAKFDETVEVHAKLGIDPRKSDQNVRGTVSLPTASASRSGSWPSPRGRRSRRRRRPGPTTWAARRSSRRSWTAGWTLTPWWPPPT
jgi:hypothetical protein